MKRRVCVLLTYLTLLMTLFVMTAAAEETGGSFVLTVSTANSMVIEPERIPYTSGQTIKEALLASGHTFTQLEEQDYIGAVDDVAGNYIILYDGGGYAVSAPASSITAMRIGVTKANPENQEDMLNLVRRMAEYRYMENHVQNYPDAQEAYKLCLNALRGDGSNAAANQKKLDDAIAAYEAILAGKKYAVTVSPTKDGVAVENPVFTMTDAYGNVTEVNGTAMRVIAGDYTFRVSDGGYNRSEGTVKVQDAVNFSVELPAGEWFGEIQFSKYEYTAGYNPYPTVQDTETHHITTLVRDVAAHIHGVSLMCRQGPDIPDIQNTRLRTIYVDTNGEDRSERNITWTKAGGETWQTLLYYVVKEGLEGRTFDLEAQYDHPDGYTMIQSYEVEMNRAPSLTKFAVYSGGTRLRCGAEIQGTSVFGNVFWLYADGYFWHQYEYAVTVVDDSLEIVAEAFSPDYKVEGTGVVPVTEDQFDHIVTVTAPDGKVAKYTLHVTRSPGIHVTLDVPEGVTGQIMAEATDEVFSAEDSQVKPQADGSYLLVPGKEYTYIGTKDTYYHTKGTFTAKEGLKVSVPEPITEDWVDDFAASSNYHYKRVEDEDGVHYEPVWENYPVDSAFTSSRHEYTYYVESSEHDLYLYAKPNKGKVYAHYLGQGNRDNPETIEVTDGAGSYSEALQFLQHTGYGISMTILAELPEENGVTYYQEYKIHFERQLNLYELDAKAGETEVIFETPNGTTTGYDRDIHDYVLTVDRDADSVVLSGLYIPHDTVNLPKEKYRGGFYSIVNGVRYEENMYWEYNAGTQNYHIRDIKFAPVTIPLTRDKDEEIVTIQICHADPTAIPATYTLTIRKSDPVPITVKANPADTLVFLTSDLTGLREYDKDGVFMLTPGRTYTYNATRYGYVGQTGVYTVPKEAATWEITLEKAPESTGLVNLPAQWPHLRLNNDNNGVISDRTPINSDDTVLYWANKIGEGFDQDACSPPIIVNDDLYVYAGKNIFRVDKTTGEVIASAEMCGSSSFGINPPTYANGMIFVGLANGRVQAFNAQTLESLWVYKDPLGGQPNCPIVYNDGYVYTGFWSGEDRVNNYVCLSTTDEDPASTQEAKIASWTYASRGGFYWSGAYVCNEFTLIGTDDGEVGYTKGYASLLSLDTDTGKVIDEVKMDVTGDIRSSITHYDGKYYFTSKGGYFFEASVAEDGEIQAVKHMKLNNYAESDSNPPMSTSTPTIYNGRAYIGVSGTGQFTAYSGHNITVIDIPNWEPAYKVRTMGYPQTSGVLTTAYEAETGKVYVYFFDNYTPGKLRILEDSPGQIAPTLISTEYGRETALNLFEPVGDQAQYALCSPVVDSDGTIYFKNDSAYLMAVGSTIDHLKIVQQPNKLEYKIGETFDATGMQVVAHFTNGVTKDVTKYLTWSEEPLTEDDTDFQLLYPIVMYQNKDGVAGTDYAKPAVAVRLTIQPEVTYGDVNEDGKITVADATWIFQYCAQRRELTESQLKAADVNGDGKITVADATWIFQYCAQRRTTFRES